MDYDIAVERIPAQKVAAINAHAAITGIPEVMAGAFPELYQQVGAQGLTPLGPPTAVYTDIDETHDGVTVEICVPVSGAVTTGGRVHEDELPAETVLKTLHRGPYEALPEAYEALEQYARDHDLELLDRMREQYLNGPPETSPEAFETEVMWPFIKVA